MPPWGQPDPYPLSYVFVSYCEVTILNHVDNPSVYTFILNVSDKFIEKCRRSRLFGE